MYGRIRLYVIKMLGNTSFSCP